MIIKLKILNGLNKGNEFSFDKLPISIGRSNKNDIIINDPYISRNHCTIYSENNFIYICDLNSKNNTYLNNKKINTPQIINGQDNVIIGKIVIQILIAN